MWQFRIHPFNKKSGIAPDRQLIVRRSCDISGCPHQGEYRAPKSRYDLQSYYWFCLDHVREYNANWDFFKGMNRVEIEHHMYKNFVWDRPTWKPSMAGVDMGRTRQKIYEHFTSDGIFGEFSTDGNNSDPQEAHIDVSTIPHPTVEALATLDLAPPVQWDEVRARYKTLAKKYHPDANKGDARAEELFKRISLAYNILKLSYQHFTELDN